MSTSSLNAAVNGVARKTNQYKSRKNNAVNQGDRGRERCQRAGATPDHEGEEKRAKDALAGRGGQKGRGEAGWGVGLATRRVGEAGSGRGFRCVVATVGGMQARSSGLRVNECVRIFIVRN